MEVKRYERLTGVYPRVYGGTDRVLFTAWEEKVYPRVYGGTINRAYALLPDNGLSPRVRGNHGSVLGRSQLLGSIPACTGEPLFVFGRLLEAQVYPRVYGEPL